MTIQQELRWPKPKFSMASLRLKTHISSSGGRGNIKSKSVKRGEEVFFALRLGYAQGATGSIVAIMEQIKNATGLDIFDILQGKR
jgi:hypothetical protein